MRVGFQTVLWGRRIDNLSEALDNLALAGFEGVEFAQHPKNLCSIQELSNLMGERDLEIIGFTGGPLRQRMEFCENHRPAYLYVDTVDLDVEEAIKRGFRIALHPHVFMPVDGLARCDTAASAVSLAEPDCGHGPLDDL